MVRDLCQGLIKSGHECKVFYFDNIVELGMPCLTERISFKQSINFAQWDIIHSHMFRPDLWVYMHKIKLRKLSVKSVTTLHQEIDKGLTFLYGSLTGYLIGRIWKFILKSFDKVVILTNEQFKELSGIKKSAISVIFNGRTIDKQMPIDLIDTEVISAFRSKYRALIGTNSNVIRIKGLEQIIKVLPFLPDIGYIIIGDGDEMNELKHLAQQLGVQEQCLWLGFKPNGFRYIALFDVYLMLSRTEGFPLSLVEAAALEKPVICSDLSVFRNIYNSEQVVFVPLDDPDRLLYEIKEVLADNKGREIALNKFYYTALTSEIMCKNYGKLYETL